ncbi:MAG TPA: hypothetical protein VHU92_30115 [Streptosporangiaceae bacterium]|jgi:hypothetical protein|nr:hypothetical protein [Streptosporangiaceae bacterium]
MGFVQIIEYTTSDIDGMRAIGDAWEHATEGKNKVRRRVITADRDQPGRYFTIVFFESFEAAMENSGLPETKALSARMAELADGPARFYNLDIVDERA